MANEPPFIPSGDEGHARIGDDRIPTTPVGPPFISSDAADEEDDQQHDEDQEQHAADVHGGGVPL